MAGRAKREALLGKKRKKKNARTREEIAAEQVDTKMAKLKFKAELQARAVDPARAEERKAEIVAKLAKRMAGVVVVKKGKTG